MSRKEIFATCIFFFSILLTLYAKGNTQQTPGDTALFYADIRMGDKLKATKPDSSISQYKKALLKLTNIKLSKKDKQYLFSLGHSRLATVYSDIHQTENAWKHNRLAMEAATNIQAKDILGKLFMNSGVLYTFDSNYDSAVYFYRKAVAMAKELNDQKLESKIYVNLGIIQFYKGNMDSAFVYFKKPLYLAQKMKDQELIAAAYNNLGVLYQNTGKLDESLESNKKAAEIYGKLKDSVSLILTENNIGGILFRKCDYAGALEQYKTVVLHSRKVNDPMQLAKAYHNIGHVYYNIYAYDEATQYYLKSIEINEKNGDKLGVASDYSTLGSVQISNKNPKKALEYYRKAFDIYTAIGNQPGLSKIYARFGDVYLELNKMDSVYFYLTKAQNLAIEIDDATSLLSIYSNFSTYYTKKGDYSKAIVYNNKLVDLTTEIGDEETKATAYSNIANIYNELKDYKKASDYALKSYKIGEENNFTGIINVSSKELKAAYAGMGEFKKALNYADIFSRTSDSLYKKTQSEAAIFAEARWQAEKKESQIQFLENEKKLKDELISVKEAENKSQRAAIYLLIGGLIILVASALVILWFIRKQRKLEFQEQLNKISQLKLENVRGRISPHFLFNSLSVIQEEIRDKPEVSKRLTAIVNMLRSSLLNIERPCITLREEIEFVEDFLLLQKNKLTNLQSDIHLSEPGLSEYKIPAMIIQIPVENSIKHGLLAKNSGEKKLVVDAKIKDEHLNIQIIDNGVGRQAPSAGNQFKGTGTGLKVINQTLLLLNSRNQKKIDFSLTDLKDEEGRNCGTEVSISIPKGFNFELN